MKSKSTFSQNIDPYRAGIEIAEDLLEIQPEIIFLFSSIHYDGSAELTEAIYDVIDSEDLIIIGCSGDGFYERNMVANVGASALAINSNGTIQWQLEYERGVGLAPFETTRRCMKRLEKACPRARVYFLFSDFRTDASEIIRAAASSGKVPMIGGMAGDNFEMERCFVYINREVVIDSVAILALSGDFPFDIFTIHNTKPEGRMGTITRCKATTIQEINNIPAMQFVEEAMGKPFDYIDTGTITANVMSLDQPHLMRHHSLFLSKNAQHDTDIHLFGGIAKGEQIQLCLTSPAKIVDEVESVAQKIDQLDFRPAAAIIISCAGRKQLLSNKKNVKITALTAAEKSPEAIAGFPSFGEIGPIKTGDGDSQSLFHNMTYILFVFGEKKV